MIALDAVLDAVGVPTLRQAVVTSKRGWYSLHGALARRLFMGRARPHLRAIRWSNATGCWRVRRRDGPVSWSWQPVALLDAARELRAIVRAALWAVAAHADTPEWVADKARGAMRAAAELEAEMAQEAEWDQTWEANMTLTPLCITSRRRRKMTSVLDDEVHP